MMHFFRKSEIHLDAFTNRRDVIEYAPIVNAMEVIPAWWKNLPKNITHENDFFPSATMKTCVGMYDYYNKSVAVPLWSDLHISTVNSGYNWQFADSLTRADVHNPKEYAGFLTTEKYGHLKIHSPWVLSTKEDLNWVYTQPIYNRTTFIDYFMAQGLLNFKFQPSANLQMFINLEKSKKFTVPFGTPFLLTPMSDKKVVVHRHLITDEQYKSKASLATTSMTVNKYKTHNKLPKCPYKDNLK
jgi:hypothetical protein